MATTSPHVVARDETQRNVRNKLPSNQMLTTLKKTLAMPPKKTRL